MEVTVECQKRPEGSKPKALRREGLIPATLYGHDGAESVALTVSAKAAETLLKNADVINHTPIQVTIPDLPWSGKALLREVQTHPWKKFLYHLSFFSMASQDSVKIGVPVHLLGTAAGVKKGGVLEHVMNEVQVECSPNNIPESIEVDVSNLELGESLHINEIVLPEGVTISDDPQRTVVNILGTSALASDSSEDSTASEAPAVI
ncbi:MULTISPECIES: 50S ribosomal protein L25/general stress protein Ctc [unclassified Coleofasciculus]|uniref:50S ribosomal protein L25/general stress protein Ctc n=1 Tax=unclassified Coleofasciculus TaxID=2692782 RepID=UPI001881146F|nr:MULTISPECIES: 50S ribosomal protein L25/general stress protein Ctc [unclassified Coleofasciculus]MBE9126189.1 50S ribosomal protein L25/general stress protein Ctc [Coleofasciculus sp. LEGE 07081]MBE9149604.1 50S ribosomal protein L25/general stress protein Ctc [Coleofasciculus sp. LEGE 07092]